MSLILGMHLADKYRFGLFLSDFSSCGRVSSLAIHTFYMKSLKMYSVN